MNPGEAFAKIDWGKGECIHAQHQSLELPYIQVEPGKSRASFKKYKPKKEFAYRMCTEQRCSDKSKPGIFHGKLLFIKQNGFKGIV